MDLERRSASCHVNTLCDQKPWTDSYGTEVPDWYEQITSAYGNLKTGLMPGGFYQDGIGGTSIYQVVNGQLVCQSAPPHGHPVIPLPAGLLASLGAPSCTSQQPTIADFGGMYGYGFDSTQKTYTNPATGAVSCPSGYMAAQVLGTPNADWPVYFCYQPHTGANQIYDFGGMYGYGAMKTYVNPATGAASCPAGYTAAQVLGTPNLDWPVYFCYRPHTANSSSALNFGGMYGDGFETARRTFVNPLTGAASCPSGFTASLLLWTANTDWPLYFCYQQLASGTSS